MNIELDGARLREFEPDDAEALARHGNDRMVWRNVRDGFPHPYTVEAAREFLARVAAGGTWKLVYCIDVRGEACGGIGCHPGEDVYRRRAELGFWLGRRYWGRGIVTQAVRAFTNHLFETTDLLRIQAEVFQWNRGSMRVLEKAGFLLEGRMRKAVVKDDQVVDVLMYARTR